jgi:1,4-dihydroxy-2-naphthoyl-CoA hydrolase
MAEPLNQQPQSRDSMARMDPNAWLELHRRVRFGDTDAAGVVNFVQLLRWCHEAYEESLERFGVAAAEVFPTPSSMLEVALPIVHCSADYFRPLVCGDPITMRLEPVRLDLGGFEVRYSFSSTDQAVAQGLTRHLAIESSGRRRCALPTAINRWLEASNVGGIQPL